MRQVALAMTNRGRFAFGALIRESLKWILRYTQYDERLVFYVFGLLRAISRTRNDGRVEGLYFWQKPKVAKTLTKDLLTIFVIARHCKRRNNLFFYFVDCHAEPKARLAMTSWGNGFTLDL